MTLQSYLYHMPILLKTLLREFEHPELSFMKDVPALKSLKDIEPLRPLIAKAAQKVYDAWDQSIPDHDDYAGGGICDDIAEAIVGILDHYGIEAISINSEGVGENHTWVVAKVREGVAEVDIPPHVYEDGSGYSWQKKPDIVFKPEHVVMGIIDDDPKTFSNYQQYS